MSNWNYVLQCLVVHWMLKNALATTTCITFDNQLTILATSSFQQGLTCVQSLVHDDCMTFDTPTDCQLYRKSSLSNSTITCQLINTTSTDQLCQLHERSITFTSSGPCEYTPILDTVKLVLVAVGCFFGGALIVFAIMRRRVRRLETRIANEMIFGERVTPKYDRRRSCQSFAKEIVIHERMQTPPPPKDDVVGIHLDLGDLELWRIDTNDLVSYRLLAKGAHGEVWIGEYKGHIVAIKKLLANEQTAQGIQKFIDEIKLTTKLDSPFITKFIGASWLRPREMELVMEYMENGDLRNYLETTKESTKFPWKQKVQCIQDICDGLVYLHSLHVIHRDLKSRNVLLGVNLEAKLTDFGISREISNETMTHGVVGTYRWIAPEILQGDRYTVAADIYSFGVILSEFDSHSIPYHGALNEKGLPLTEITLLNLVRDGAIKPYFSQKCLPWVYELAMQCLETDPSQRPTAPEIASFLRRSIRQAQYDTSFKN